MRELIVDSFAGGGGASLGIERALGRSPDIAINHDPEALSMHARNHPATRHLAHNIWKVDPVAATGGRPVGLLWASPDCKHHSKAKGGKPRAKNIRDLAWVVVRWARQVRPRVIILENVEEFRHWGPLLADGLPCPDRKGQTFDAWVGELRRLGYRVEWRELRACDYGAPTIRKRLFLIARRDGRPIVWPAATHGAPASEGVRAGRLRPWRTAADIIDWSIPCPSIFLTREEGRAIGVNRPLADATMARIAKGVKRYVLDAAEPFIVPVTHMGDTRAHPIGEPLRTVTTASRGEHAVVAPYLVPRYGERPGQEPRTMPVDAPAPTVVPTGNGGSLAAVYLAQHYTGQTGRPADEPISTIVHRGTQQAIVAAHVVGVAHGDSGGRRSYDASEPLTTVQAGGNNQAIVAAHLQAYYGEGNGGADRSASADEPIRTVTTENRHAVVAAFLAQHNTDMVGHAAREPVSTILGKGCNQAVIEASLLSHAYSSNTAGGQGDPRQPLKTVTAGGGHAMEVRAFLTKYYGAEQDLRLGEPLHTVTTKDRFGLVTVAGEVYRIADIGMRMLTPRELFRAQGFGDDYQIDEGADGEKLTKTAQVRMCGNSVCPPMAEALVAANYRPDEATATRPARPTPAMPLFAEVAA
jgi:DNA (cytosine-5)-methyltransferase 1